MAMDLCTAAGLERGDVVAFVGAGGKTGAMFRAAKELVSQGYRVITTTTTMIWQPSAAQSRVVIVEPQEDRLLANTRRELSYGAHVTVAASPAKGGKLRGIQSSTVGRLSEMADIVLVEADGARGLSLKAPAPHEPVIPPSTTVVMPVVAVDAVGEGLTEGIAHRPERVAAVTGLSVGETITAEIVGRLLASTKGGLKAIPNHARVVCLVNKIDAEADLAAGREIARSCLNTSRVDSVLLAAVADDPPVRERWQRVSAVVLAAGESRRFGSTKQLLSLGDETLLGHVLKRVCASWASEVLVVLGHAAQRIGSALEDSSGGTAHRWRTVLAEGWAGGQSVSVKEGLAAVSSRSQAVIFVLGDQPDITGGLVNELLVRYAQTGAPIVAVEHGDQLLPPVLFDRSTFDELRCLSGDAGGREVVRRHIEEVERVVLPEACPFRDIDTPEDYSTLKAEGWRAS